MAHCKDYQELPHQEKMNLTGTVIHIFQNDTESFKAMLSLIRIAEQNGVLEGVEMNPEPLEDMPIPDLKNS